MPILFFTCQLMKDIFRITNRLYYYLMVSFLCLPVLSVSAHIYMHTYVCIYVYVYV